MIPTAQVKVSTAATLGDETLRMPFSSLASQAVGPIESDFEMVFAGPAAPRPRQEAACSERRAARRAGGECERLATWRQLVGAGGRGLNTTYTR